MGVGLQPLEFTDCLTDSPYFREKLHAHEKELEKTSEQIKRLVKEVKTLLSTAKSEYCNITARVIVIINFDRTLMLNDRTTSGIRLGLV